jgi:hypothetical protein
MLYLFSSSSGQNKISAQQLPHHFFPPLRNQRPIGDRWIQNHLFLIIAPIAFRNFATICGGSMGSPAVLIALIVHCPLGYWFLPRWPRFLLFWLSEVVLVGSGPELSLSSSVGLGGPRRCLILPVGAAYIDNTCHTGHYSYSLLRCN